MAKILVVEDEVDLARLVRNWLLCALLRCPVGEPRNAITIGDVVIGITDHRVTKCGREVHLLPKEFRLLEFLARHPHQVFSACVKSLIAMVPGRSYPLSMGSAIKLSRIYDV